MKWVTVNRTHINTNNLDCFCWDGVTSELTLWYSGDKTPVVYQDPDRALYLKLCRQQGIAPVNPED